LKIKFLFLVIAVITSISCASQKKKNRPEYDLFDNITAKYNIIHHAKIMITKVETDLLTAYEPHFYEVLPIVLTPNEAFIAQHTADLDSVIGKAKRVIDEKNKSKYSDQAYFILGQASYYKGHYHQAAAYFDYVTLHYSEKKKLSQLARVWQAKSLLASKSFEEGEVVWDSILSHLDDYKGVRGWIYANRSDYLLRKNEEIEAINYLEAAVKSSGNRLEKQRWRFALAQLLEKQGALDQAVAHYKKVSKSNASYELAFQAALSATFLSAKVQNDGPQNTIRSLKKMLRDDKNKGTLDQIHYYLAVTHADNNEMVPAREALNASVRVNSGNRHQATLSYLKLAEIAKLNKEFSLAQRYYDSAATVLPMDYKDVNQVRRHLVNMDKLLTNLQFIAQQDSLIYLSNLSGDEQAKALQEIAVARYMKEVDHLNEQKKLGNKKRSKSNEFETASTAFDSSFDLISSQATASAVTDHRFYFNNPDAIGMGMSAFKRRWGNRPNQDNWRYSSEMQLSGLGNQAENTLVGEDRGIRSEDQALTGKADVLTVDSAAYIQNEIERWRTNLFADSEELTAAHEKVKTSFIENGEIYRFNLNDVQNSILTYEELLNRYPNEVYAANWWFNLAQLYTMAGDPKAAQSKSTLVNNYPESIYAKLIDQPSYLKELEAEQLKLNQWYERMYLAYEDGEYEEVLSQIGEPAPNAQFAYLRALAVGRTAPATSFVSALEKLTQTFANDSLIKPLAEQHLAFIGNNQDLFAQRDIALMEMDGSENARLLSEAGLIKWPQSRKRNEEPAPRRTIPQFGAQTAVTGSTTPVGSAMSEPPASIQLAGDPGFKKDEQPVAPENNLFPANGTFYFVMHILHPTVNLAPSRFGIGQFNRSQFGDLEISHQLKKVGDESQLVYIGPFDSYIQAQLYESRIVPLLKDIMKIPAEFYQTFLINDQVFGTLSDFGKVDDYYQFYISR
jgi:tetratricopeptide (TPR) repeat protein